MKNSKLFARSAVFFLLAASFSFTASADDISVTSNFDKRSVRVGEEIHLTIRIAGSQGNVQAPRLPTFKNFDTYYTGRASHITFINGQSSSSVEFSYSLVPRQPGSYTLEAIEVFVNNQRFATPPVQIEVQEGGAANAGNYPPNRPPFGGGQPPQQQQQQTWQPQAPAQSSSVTQEPPLSFQPEDDNIFVKAWVDKTEVYPNEQILLTYSLYTRYDTRLEGFEEEPQVSGFWIEEFPMERDVRKEAVRVNSKRYVKADLRKMALFPTAPAEYTIRPGVLKASIRQEAQQNSIYDEFFDDSFFSGGSFFSRRENRTLKPPVIQLKVKPFPEEGKPESFQGAVGNFRISATLDKTTVKQNEPVTMKMVIEGDGNIETLNKPKTPELTGFKVYDADTSSNLFKTGNVIGGRKTFEIVFIPLEAGGKKLPAMEFTYFNPIQARYVTVKTPEFNLNVTPSEQTFKLPESLSGQDILKQEVKRENQDIRFIRDKMPDTRSGRVKDTIFKALVFGDVFLTFLIFVGFLKERQEMIFARDVSLKRRSVARSRAEARMRKLKSFARLEDPGKYFEEVEKIMTQYLSDKFNISAYGATRFELEQQLENVLGPQDPLFQEIRGFYDLCEEARFARAVVPQEMKVRALKVLRDTVARVERLKR